MKYVLKGANVYINGSFKKTNIFVSNGIITNLSNSSNYPLKSIIFDFSGFFIFPGLIDVHVHLREPGFSYKETIKTGSMSASHGGFTTICTMPNLKPTPDNLKHLQVQLSIIKKDSVIEIIPYGAITKGEKGIELSNYEEMKDFIVGISDDGVGVQNNDIMQNAMIEAKKNNLIIADHCEDSRYLNNGYINDGIYAKRFNHRGITNKSEYIQIRRDINLLKKTNSKHHICHVSTKESVRELRKAKKLGLNITCETAPHYLVLCENDLKNDGAYKMNPPLRSLKDKQALIEGIIDGTIDIIATDHAPHSIEEKSKGLEKSLNGIVGLETSFPILYTYLVKENIISLEKLLALMHDNPKKIFNIGNDIKVGEKANLTVFDLNSKYTINQENFLSKGRSSPFNKIEVYGLCKMTMVNGKIIWEE